MKDILNNNLTSRVCFYAFRLPPGAELLSSLRDELLKSGIHSGWIAGAVGSISHAALRFAGRPDSVGLDGCFEVVSLIGTLDSDGEHLHISISDQSGHLTGGHIMKGCIIRTTMELVIGSLIDVEFSREPCELSGYDELTVKAVASCRRGQGD